MKVYNEEKEFIFQNNNRVISFNKEDKTLKNIENFSGKTEGCEDDSGRARPRHTVHLCARRGPEDSGHDTDPPLFQRLSGEVRRPHRVLRSTQ